MSTRVLSPGKAVIWAAFFNFVAAFTFGTAVAKTVGSGMVDVKIVTFAVIFGGLIGAIVWDLITWYYGLPTSSSHALIGGYAGAAVAKAGFAAIIAERLDQDARLHRPVAAHRPGARLRHHDGDLLDLPLDAAVARRSLVPPAAAACRRRPSASTTAPTTRRRRWGSSPACCSPRGYIDTFYIPFWVVLAAHAAIGLGTLAGGWRIIHTMGSKITKLQPVGGFAAETGAAIAIFIATQTRRAGQHDARDHRRDRRRRRDAAAVGGALGRRRPDRLGLGADDSRPRSSIAAGVYTPSAPWTTSRRSGWRSLIPDCARAWCPSVTTRRTSAISATSASRGAPRCSGQPAR